MTYADVADVAAELGQPVFTDENVVAQIDAWLLRAEAVIRRRIPDLDDLVSDGGIDVALVVNVEAAVVARKVRNPEGLHQSTVAVDDGTVTKIRQGAGVDADLQPTEAEWALLMPPETSSAFTIRPSGTGPTSHYPDRWPL